MPRTLETDAEESQVYKTRTCFYKRKRKKFYPQQIDKEIEARRDHVTFSKLYNQKITKVNPRPV